MVDEAGGIDAYMRSILKREIQGLLAMVDKPYSPEMLRDTPEEVAYSLKWRQLLAEVDEMLLGTEWYEKTHREGGFVFLSLYNVGQTYKLDFVGPLHALLKEVKFEEASAWYHKGWRMHR